MKAACTVARFRRNYRSALCKVRLLLCVITAGLSTTAHLSAAQEAQPQTRFQRTILSLQDASADVRSDFAAAALANLASAYSNEAKLARQQAGRNAQLRAWSSTVERYASQMPLLLDDIALGLPVQLGIGGETPLTITVGDRTVIVSHPRLSQQSALEQGILMDFCSRNSCEQLSPREAGAEPIPVSSGHVRPTWTFSAQGSNCAYRGITVRFTSAQNMAKARLICEQFLQEVVTLTEELAWQQRHAVVIEWEQLDIQSTPGRPEHMVRLNTAGDSVLVTIPVLRGSTGLLEQVIPWVRQQLSEQQELAIEVDADHYGWQRP